MARASQFYPRLLFVAALVPFLASCGTRPQKSSTSPSLYTAGFPQNLPLATIQFHGRTFAVPLVSATWIGRRDNLSKSPPRRYSWPLRVVLGHQSQIRFLWHPAKEPDMVMVSFYSGTEVNRDGIPDAAPENFCEVNATYPTNHGCSLVQAGVRFVVPHWAHSPIYTTVAALWVPQHMPKNPATLVQHQAKWAVELIKLQGEGS